MTLQSVNRQFLFPFFLLVTTLSFTNFAGAQDTTGVARHHKVAVVLSGGGAKGFAHVGVLKVLEEEGIPIDIIVGTSMGSLIGGFYSLGYNADEIREIVKKQDWENILSDHIPRIYRSKNDQITSQRYLISLPYNEEKNLSLPMGVIKGQNVLNLFCGLAGNVPVNADFTQFPISFACVAADLETGQEVVMKNGFLPTAVFSSMAIPGVFEPSERGGLILVDGGVVNNFPTDVAKEMGADIIIGVDIQSDFYTRSEIKSMGEILGQMINFLGMDKNTTNDGLCDLVIRPDITGYTAASFTDEAADTLILRGEKAAGALREQLEELKVKYHLVPKKISRKFVAPDQWKITALHLTGAKHLNESFLKKRLSLPIPGDYSYDEIKNAIDRLYGYGGFDKIYFTLDDNLNGGKTLNLNLIAEKEFSLNIGFKVNTTDAAALLLNVRRKNYGNTLGLLSASAELSANPGFSMQAETTSKKNFPVLGAEINGKYQNYDIYEKGDKLFNADLYYASGSIYMYQSFLKKYYLGLGVQEEYFNGDVFSKNHNSSAVSEDQTDYFNTNVYSYFSLDNLDNFYFSSKGTNLYVEFSFDTDLKRTEKISPALLFKMRNVIPLGHKTALLFNLYGRALYSSGYPRAKSTLIGGDSYSQYFSYHLPFIGLPPVIVADRYAFIGLLGLRLRLSRSQYVSLVFNRLQQGSSPANWKGANAVYGGGLKYSLKTIIGPVDVGIGYSDLNDKLTFSANLGYWF